MEDTNYMYMYNRPPSTDLGNTLDPLGLEKLLRSGLITLGQQTQLQFTRRVEWVGQGTVRVM